VRIVSDLRSQRAAVESAVRHGDLLPDIEAEIDAHTELSEEDRSALWLYAWSRLETAGGAHDTPDRESATTTTLIPG
jgi:hypothetical protein